MAVKKKSKGSGFKYRKRDAKSIRKRANQPTGAFDRLVKDEFQEYRPKDGLNVIRILPPTFAEADHYGFDMWVHYGVGAENSSYPCPKLMGVSDSCPVCEECDRASREGDKEYAGKLRATKRVLVWVIDRDKEEEGPKPWPMPVTMDKKIASLSQDRSGEVYYIDDPESGYDFEFQRAGKPPAVQYSAEKVARRASPLSNSPRTMREWLDFITENPLDTVWRPYDEEYIRAKFEGGTSNSDDDDNDDDEDTPMTRRQKRKTAVKAKGKRKVKDEDDEIEEEEDEVEEEEDEVDEDEEESDDEDEDEEDEDEDDEDEDESDDEDEDEEDEDEEDEDEDDEDEEEEDEEEEEPAPKRKAKAKPKASAKSSKSKPDKKAAGRKAVRSKVKRR